MHEMEVRETDKWDVTIVPDAPVTSSTIFRFFIEDKKTMDKKTTIKLPRGWIEACVLLIVGRIGRKEARDEHGPFRTREKAEKFAKTEYRGYTYEIVPTFVEEKFTKFRGLPRRHKEKRR